MEHKIDPTRPKGQKWLLQGLVFNLILTISMFASSVLAQDLTDVQEIGELAGMLQAWMSGELGMLILMVGLLVAVIMVVARASLMPVLFVLGLSIILGWGPRIFAAILGSAN